MPVLFKEDYKIADPICTFIFSILVFLTTAPIIRDIFNVLMEGKKRFQHCLFVLF